MLIEDQYGVGDSVKVGEVEGVVEKVGLRVTTVRDPQGTLWYRARRGCPLGANGSRTRLREALHPRHSPDGRRVVRPRHRGFRLQLR